MTKAAQGAKKTPRHAILLVSCPDRRGLVAEVTAFLTRHQGNILHLDQHVDLEENIFFMRVEWDLEGFTIPEDEIAHQIDNLTTPFEMTWKLHFTSHRPKAALLVTKLSHCLYDILGRYHAGEWNMEIPLIISNHDHLRPVAEQHGIPFHVFNINKDNKAEQEAAQLALMKEHDIDFVVLARYMQILSGSFIESYPNRIINIHHSFLPAFPGARPYHSAYSRGVKLVGATSHYVTEDLDAGPIIEQDTMRVSHKDTVKDMVRKGKDLEKIVLARAIRLHLDRRLLVYLNKTIVFE